MMPQILLGQAMGTAFARKGLFAIGFILFGYYLGTIAPTVEIAWSLNFLLLTIYLFTFEIFRVDLTAILIMVLLGATNILAPFLGLSQGLVDDKQLFQGFASNAVIAIMAVMVIGAGLDKTGLMSHLAGLIMRVGGTQEKRIVPIISGTVGIISSFMQNVGSAALFLPVISRISNRTGLPMSRLLMPMGFSAILGGTITLIGSSPLILLNDLMLTSNQYLPETQQLEAWSLFSVTPIGIGLLVLGISYFMLASRWVLPAINADEGRKETTLQYLKRSYGIDFRIMEVEITEDSDLIGRNLLEIETQDNVRIIAMKEGNRIRAGVDSLDRNLEFHVGQVLGIVGLPEREKEFVDEEHLLAHQGTPIFGDLLSDKKSGMAEIVIPSHSNLVGKSAIDVWMRKRYGISLMGILRNGEVIYAEDENVSEIRRVPFQAGDLLLVYCTWEALEELEGNRDFIIITADYPRKEKSRPEKVHFALTFFLLSICLVLFTDLRLANALLIGVVGMILTRVISLDEAYEAISWKTVFLLASLIPLGTAVESSGTAKWIATQVLKGVGDLPIWGIELVLAILATAFTLVMSNVGATVILVPLAINIALGLGANPAVFALLVTLCTSNAFLIPTHQVNALIMGPGGYRVRDFLRAGSVMSLLFIGFVVLALNLFGYH